MRVVHKLHTFPLFAHLILFLFLIIGEVSANNQEYYFKQISLQEGLSQSSVRCILNDHKGFIWIGTRSGLNRFDRYELKNYFYEKGDSTSLPHNLIHFVAEDSLYNIWIGTEMGLVTYNYHSDNFTRVYFNGQPLIVRSYIKNNDGIIFGARGSLYKYSYTKKLVEELPVKGNQLPTVLAYQIRRWTDNLLLINSRWNGTYTYDLRTHRLEPITFCPEKEIVALYIDNQKQVWISPYGKGLYCYSPQKELIHQFNTVNSGLTNNIILDILEKDKNIWLATDGGGINILNTHQNTISGIESNQGYANAIQISSIYCFYQDTEENIWAGSVRGGLFGVKSVFMRTYRNALPGSTVGLSEKAVISIYEDKDKTVWIGTDGGGINHFDPQTNRFKHFPHTYKEKVASITEFSPNELLISLFGKGLFIFNKQTGEKRPFTQFNQIRSEEAVTSGNSINVLRTDENNIAILAEKIYLYNQTNQTFKTCTSNEKYIPQSSLQTISNNPYVTYLFGQHRILEMNNSLGTVQTIININPEIIQTICRDDRGVFWISTNTGLYSYSLITKELTQVRTNLFTDITSLVYDNQGHLWIGARGMLFTYSIKENRFVIFGESDGAFTNEYMPKAALLSSSGDMYMGGVNGLLRIDKKTPFMMKSPPPTLQLMDISLDGISITHRIDGEDKSVNIPWDHSLIIVKTMAKEKDVFRKKMFKYSVYGLNNSETESYDHTLTLRSLSPGTYAVNVSCSNQDGSWSQPVELVSIHVMSPWWKTTPFIIATAFLLSFLIILVIYLVIKKKESNLKWKMKEHQQKSYEEKVRFLINISHELRTPLTLIYAPLKRLLTNETPPEDSYKQLTGVLKQVKQMKSIINMVLDVRKMEIGQCTLHTQSIHLNEWIHSVAEDFDSELRLRNIRLEYQLSPQIDQLSFDKEKCEIILSNLLMNAFKFSQSNTCITIRTSITEEDKVRVSVEDQGIGLSGADTSQLFTRFYQGNHDRKGSGIGLSYSKMLVEMHGGTIGARNNEGEGATFFYELPNTNETQTLTNEPRPYLNELLYSPEANKVEVTTTSTQLYSILVVDDEPDLRQFLKEVLTPYLKEVYTAENGEDALRILLQYQPDIVVSDVMMPVMDGFQLCKKIKENIEISHIPVILLTARTDSDSASFGYKLGADSYVAKPFDVDFLLTIINNQLRNREQIKLRYKNNIIHSSPQDDTFSNADEQFLLKLNQIISDNISNPELDVKFIIEQISMSRSSFYNKMKELTDIGASDYINRIRMERATYQLQHTQLTIQEIADSIGYTNQSYFSTAFKQSLGCSPTKFRQKPSNHPVSRE